MPSVELARGPTVSADGTRGKTPSRGIRPWVTFKPNVPHSAAGTRTEPPVSVPIAIEVMPADTAAPDPPDDPPGDVSGSHGFLTAPMCGFSDENPKAHSWRPVRPTMTAPASSSLDTHVADAEARCR